MFRPERNSNPDLCDAGGVLHQLSYQANWKLVIMWVDYKPVDDSIYYYSHNSSHNVFLLQLRLVPQPQLLHKW